MLRFSLLFTFALLLAYKPAGSQLVSPQEFLGYEVGTKFTPHWKIVDYFKHVASQAPDKVLVKPYGFTNEGRPLMVAIVSSASNMSKLEQIRVNNLRLASLGQDKAAADENAPAIVWLSYNVHGNESSSSEVSLLTLFALADKSNLKTNDWLNNTIVIIDPCVNPDGRDRYVNWFNSVVGKNPDPKIHGREHKEPWPNGRTNHYNFDLNRDWAWQTQVESQQRIELYNQWMPQVHVDFHEQGYNEPYYFAPAAEPFHEVITPWQRGFQASIGKNHAKYFDEKGWLYFTREIFDLYYPSYGDTWPTYNGAIGMTYEQGGSGAGGLAVINDEGDTLTLRDRVQHHFTTSLSTIEISSLNSSKLVKEFRKYFNDAVSGVVGEYKTYIIKNNARDQQKIKALSELLTRNGIQFGTSKTATVKGYNYQSGREESLPVDKDLVISALQPRSAMIKVLFEPRSKLPDSLTYDITAWSLPYAYGLTALATREKLGVDNLVRAAFVPNIPSDSYGYLLRWEGVQTARSVSQLLKRGIRLRFSETPFVLNGQQYERGSIIILKNGNEGKNLAAVLAEIANSNSLKVEPISTGFVDKGYDFGSDKVHPLKAPKVVLLTGEGISYYGAGEVWHFMEKELDYPVTLVNLNDINRMDWSEVDLLIMPSGNYRFLSDKPVADEFKNWINKGGRVIAMESAVAALAKTDWGLKNKKPAEEEKKEENENYEALKRFEDRERDMVQNNTPGSIYKVELDNTHPLAFGYPDYYYTLKLSDNVYEFLKEGNWNVGVIKKNNQVAGFVGAKLKDKLKDGLVFGVQAMGEGTITYLADNVLFRNFWENGKLMFCNALFFVGQ